MQYPPVGHEYRQTLEYLYTRLPMFSRIGAAALKPDLTNTLALCAALGNPERKFRSIHIAGTNGKGSTSHMLAAIMQNAGFKTGLYTSPHLVDFRERIRINGEPVSEEFVNRFVAAQKPLIESVSPSFFEITVAMAFAAFAEAEVDIAIIETGLGGRLDSTNVITPELSIITNISLDHTDLLGNTIAEIAREKAGIIKSSIPVIIGIATDEAKAVFDTTATDRQAPIYYSAERWTLSRLKDSNPGLQHFTATSPNDLLLDIITDLTGSYQQDNIAAVLTAVEILTNQGWPLKLDKAAAALRAVKNTTGLRGRWDVLQNSPLIIADVAHNPAGLETVLKDWKHIPAKKKHIVVGFVRDKDVAAALALFPSDAVYYFCAADTPRALPAAELAAIAMESGLTGTVYPSVTEAVLTARAQLRTDDALLITGSFFIVGEAMQTFSGMALGE